MEVVGFVLGMIVTGAVVGGLGRLALPGPDPMSFWETVAVGIGGSLLAGVLIGLLTGWEATAGIVASVLGATFLVWLLRRSRQQKGLR